MNDDLGELQRRLEWATAPANMPDKSADKSLGESPDAAQIASLREGWLALGQLLETAQPAPDEPLQLRCLQANRPAPRATWRWWKVAGITAVAAALTIGVTLAWSLMRNRSVDPTQPGREMVLESDGSKTQQPDTGLATTVAKQTELPDMSDADALDWDDSLDDQIALVGRRIIEVQGNWYGLDDALSPVRDGIDQIEEEFESDTL